MIKVTAPVRIDISAGWSDAAPFANDFGGAVLNAALNLRVAAILDKGKLISSLEKVPSNSGLGTSGALRAVYLVAANPSLIKDKIDLIKRVHTFENAIVSQRAGYQDQAAAVFGGVNLWEFRKDGSISRTPISKPASAHLHNRIIIVFSGGRHLSANVHEKVFENGGYIKHLAAINRMKQIARLMAASLTNEVAMSKYISETWELQKSLHGSMESDNMKKIQLAAQGFYLACRATGAGGGGCMIFYTNQKARLARILKKLEKRIKGMKVLPFEWDYRGIELTQRYSKGR